MFLEKFSDMASICIQCHDSPDADALGAGYGLYCYFQSMGKQVHLIYTGEHRITKPSLLLMVDRLEVPVEYVTELPEHDILVTVDCQYKGGNITPLSASKVAMIDHHSVCVDTDEWCCIFPEFGSCCTVVWWLLKEIGYEVNEHQKALTDYYYDEEWRFALLHTRPCDPNLLGVISDLVSCVATIDYCVVYNETPIGYKLSVRSAKKELSASTLADAVTRGLGTGGGHYNKAGGMIMKQMIARQYPSEEIEQILRRRLKQCISEVSC